ncbi:MAG TPA: heat-inducible transcriptional repressor HrcA [Acidimicrobiia bacterium]|nr:heat-inducible transcriptional repressor HrcA [Acidimicrobiia bacterium]
MASVGPMDLDERKAAILRAVVEEYIETAEPVGSQRVARSRRLGVSSATVRNDMTVLEHEGYITQPHTSAGRIPTDLGYRYFVDHFTKEGALRVAHQRAVAEFFATAHRALEDLLHETSQLLSRVTDHTAMVVGPQPEVARVRGVQLVALHPGVVLAVAVLSNGAIEKHTLELPDRPDDAQVSATAAALEAQWDGSAFNELPALAPSGDDAVDALAHAVRAGFGQVVAERPMEMLYVGGTSRLAAEHESFATAESAAHLLELLEHQVVVVSLVRSLLDQGVNVSIGSENEIEELRDCAIVLAPYQVEGEFAGTVGVLGPTRMDYRQTIGAVAAVSQQLGRLLTRVD